MKKYLMLALVALLTACGSDTTDEPDAPVEISDVVEDLWKNTLVGTFKTEFYYNATSDKLWYTETITFHPYDKPRTLSPLEVYADKTVTAFGTADIADSRFTSISGTSHCYYTLYEDMYEGKLLTVAFYPYADDNGAGLDKADVRHVTPLFSGNFYMWPKGLTEEENKHLYTKQ